MNISASTHASHNGTAGIGARLRRARTEAGLTPAQLAARLHVPTRIVEDIEDDRFERLGADVYVRGHLCSYGREVGLPRSEIEDMLNRISAPAPDLVCMAPTSRWQARLDALGQRALYIALTAAIVVPILWLATSQRLPSSPEQLTVPLLPERSGDLAGQADESTDLAPMQVASASLTPSLFAGPESAARPAHVPSQTEASASDAGFWAFSFEGESWFELYDADGRAVVRELMPTGARLDYPSEAVGRVTLGNAAAVIVERAGEPVDLSRFQNANVARFTVSSQGGLAPYPGDG